MAIETRANKIYELLNNHLKAITSVVLAGSLTDDTIADLKDKAKGIVDDAKDELDLIKDEVDNW